MQQESAAKNTATVQPNRAVEPDSKSIQRCCHWQLTNLVCPVYDHAVVPLGAAAAAHRAR